MTSPDLHPWLSTPDAYQAAQKAVAIPRSLLGMKAQIIGADELLSEALAIMTECALPPREQLRSLCAHCGGSLAEVRKGAKFCTASCKSKYAVYVQRKKNEAIPPRTGAHIGSMWGWPEAEMQKYAVREVGYLLANYLRTCNHSIETPASEALANMSLATPVAEDDPRDRVEEYLESKGVMCTGAEPLSELIEAALHLSVAPEELARRVAV